MDQREISKPDKKYFDEFPPVTREEWEAAIYQDLKGQDYQKKLVWKTYEGFDIMPYYMQEDLESLVHLTACPGEFPFIRGNGKESNIWKVRQDIKVDDPQKADIKAADLLRKGITSLGLVFNEKKDYTQEDIEVFFKNVLLGFAEVNVLAGMNFIDFLKIILTVVDKYNLRRDNIFGSLNYDPLGNLAIKGNFFISEEEDFNVGKKLILMAKDVPGFRMISINGQHFHNAGASIVEELAFSLTAGTEYIHRLTDRGLSVNQISPRLSFTFGVGSDYFLEIAKLRAARMLWAHIMRAFGPENENLTQMNIHVETSRWNMTLYDPYVNVLRSTTESMSAIIGGADSLTVLPFDSAYAESSEFSERLARNQQLLLKEEAYLQKVIDPAAGSYYIENLTSSIADEVWKLFLHIEEKGGYLQAFKEGYVQSKIKETASTRDIAIAQRRDILLGSNQYPDFTEHIDAELPAEVTNPVSQHPDNILAEPLKPYRGAMAFERLRYRTDRFAIANKRPEVFMLTYGNLAMRRARSQFAGNFFGCAGFGIIDNPGFDTVKEGIEAALASHAEIVVICSSDEEYSSLIPEVFPQLRNDKIIVLAGYPKDYAERFKMIGLKHFIHVRSNILETLEGFQKELNIF
ncbi:MAG: methylmalonyl-CoA mutase family protein [Bacteroidetes bacterium]|nr:methylmalonyl-CoA mutase family protein [Bacteroidota bacterium]